MVKVVWNAVQKSQKDQKHNVLLREKFDIEVPKYALIDAPSSLLESFLSEKFQTGSPYKILVSSS